MVSGDVRGQLCAGLSAGAVQSSGVVSPQSGAGPVGAAAADSGVRPRAAAVWPSAHLGAAAPRGLGGESQAGAAAVSARRVAAPHARPAAQAHRPAPGPGAGPAGPTERWSMDFVHDALADGRPFRVLTVVDQWSRSEPGTGGGLENVRSHRGRGVGSGPGRTRPGRARSRWITAPSSSRGRSKTGRIAAACNSTSSGPANPWKTRSSSRSMGGSGTSV